MKKYPIEITDEELNEAIEYDQRIKFGKYKSDVGEAWKIGTHEAWTIGERELID